jgi:hypothetical protein
MKSVLIATLALTLMACAASSPRIDPARIGALKKGETTVDEVVRQFGRPSVISRNPDGTQSAIYLYGAEGQSGTTMVPLIATSPADSTTFYFDTKGVLTDYKIKETERAAPAQAAEAVPAAAAQPAGTQASSDKTAPAKPATAQTTTKKPLPPNVTDRWPGSTTENR